MAEVQITFGGRKVKWQMEEALAAEVAQTLVQGIGPAEEVEA